MLILQYVHLHIILISSNTRLSKGPINFIHITLVIFHSQCKPFCPALSDLSKFSNLLSKYWFQTTSYQNPLGSFQKKQKRPWLVLLSGWSTSLWTKGSPVRFLVRVCAWVAVQAPSRGRVRGNHTKPQNFVFWIKVPDDQPYLGIKLNHW